MEEPPPPLKRGLRYINSAYNKLRSYVIKTRVIPRAGWTETDQGLMPPPFGAGGSDAPCTAFKVGVDGAGNLTQNAGLFHSAGPKAGTFGGYIDGASLVDGTAATINDVIYLKIEYSPVDATVYTTGWQVEDATFIVQASVPSDHLLEWNNDTANNWDSSPDGAAHFAWAAVVDDGNGNPTVETTECGHIICTMCLPQDIRVATGVGATITSGFIPPTSDADLADGEVWNDGGTLKIYSA